MVRRRRASRRFAADAGLGAVRRVHRQRMPWVLRWGGPGSVAGAVVVGVCALVSQPDLWWLTIGPPALVVAGWVAVVHLWPPGGPAGRRWFAVCDNGLVIWPRRRGGDAPPPVAVRWTSLRGVTQALVDGRERPAVVVSWRDGGHTETLVVRAVTRPRALLETLARHAGGR